MGKYLKILLFTVIVFLNLCLSVFSRTLEDADNIMKSGEDAYHNYDFPNAIKKWSEAAEVFKELKDDKHLTKVYEKIGQAQEDQGDYPEAFAFYQNALRLYQKMEDKGGEGGILFKIGKIYELLGNYSAAFSYYQQSLSVREKIGDLKAVGNTLVVLGKISFTLGDYHEAKNYYEKARKTYEQHGDQVEIGNILCSFAELYFAEKNYDQSMEAYRKASQIFEITENKAGKRIAAIGQGDILLEQGKLEDAQKIYDEGGDKIRLGRIYLIKSSYQEAKKLFTEHLDTLQGKLNSENLFAVHTGLGLAREGLEEYQEAETHFRKAMALLEAIRDSLTSGQQIRFTSGKTLGFPRIEAYEGLSRVLNAEGKAGEAFSIAEYTRGRILLETLAGRVVEIKTEETTPYGNFRIAEIDSQEEPLPQIPLSKISPKGLPSIYDSSLLTTMALAIYSDFGKDEEFKGDVLGVEMLQKSGFNLDAKNKLFERLKIFKEKGVCNHLLPCEIKNQVQGDAKKGARSVRD